jgi:hypothetical protein
MVEEEKVEEATSDQSPEDKVTNLRRKRDYMSGHFSGPCYQSHHCNAVCFHQDKNPHGGHCSRWGGACWCNQP